MFKCKVCSEKDKRIDDLKAEIARLATLVLPQNRSGHLPLLDIEANKILDASHDPFEVSADIADPNDEANAILTGAYSERYE